MTETSAPRSSSVRWQIVALLMAFAFLNHFSRTSMAVAKPTIQKDFGFSDVDMGAIYSAFLAAYVLCMIPGGWFADRLGPRLALVVTGLGTATFMCLTGLAGMGLLAGGLAFTSFLAIRFFMGAFTAPLFPAAGRAVANWIPLGGRAWANGLVLGATTFGVGVSHVVFGKLLDAFGWRWAFVMIGGATAILAVVWWLFARNRPSQHGWVNQAERQLMAEPSHAIRSSNAPRASQPSEAAAQSRQPDDNPYFPPPDRLAVDQTDARRSEGASLLRNRNLMLVTMVYVAIGYFEYMLFYWMEHYFNEVRHFSIDDSRFYSTLAPLPMMVTMPLGGWLSDKLVRRFGYRIGRSAVPIFGMLASAALLPMASLVDDRLYLVALVMAAHGAIGLCEAPTWVAGLELGGAFCATSAAIVNTGGNFGGMIAPYVTPLIGQRFGWAWGLGAGSILCLLAVCMWIWIDPSPRPIEAARPEHEGQT